MKNNSVLLTVFLCLVAISSLAREPSLTVSEDNRYLTTPDGTTFFYLGDTAWELFHRLDREEADAYLSDRSAKGFTVIQAVALAEEDGLNTPNSYGHRPLIDNNPARPEVKEGEGNDYWDHVDYIVEKANELGMFVGMLPTWGDKWNLAWGVGPEVFTPDNAEAYGEWLGRRYRDHSIIWILGGDRPIEKDEHRRIIEAMVRGIKRGDGGAHLMTFHPSGGRNSADVFHNSDWLDFNMIQSGHRRPGRANYEFMLENLQRKPQKPTLDGEPCYEDHPVKGSIWNQRNKPGVLLPWFDEWDTRVAAYQSMLSGACGHTYGDHNIWQMWLPGRPPKSVARTPWPEALHHPGSQQMKYFRDLFQVRPFWKMRWAPTLIVDSEGVHAARSQDGSFCVVYLPEGQPATIALERLSGETINAWWFSPRQNSSQLIGEFMRTKLRTFTPPSAGRNNDWVLVIDDSSKGLPKLGFSHQNIIPKVKD